MKKKKLLAVFGSICLILVLASLPFMAACPAPAPPEEVTPPPPEEVTPPPPEEEKPIAMYIATTSPKTDGSWGQSQYEGYLLIKEKYPEVDVTFAEELPWGEAEAAIEMQADRGVNILFLDSWYEAIEKIAPKYPNSWFRTTEMQPEQFARMPSNVTVYIHRLEEGAFLSGVAAGMMTKTNKIAYVPPDPFADVVLVWHAFKAGVEWVNPDAELSYMFTGTFSDVEKGYEIAKALIAQGADVLIHFSDNAGFGVFKAAEEAGVWVIGEARDQYEYAPNNIITSFLLDHPRLAEKVLLDYKAGTLKKGIFRFGLREGWEVIAPLTNVPVEVKAKVEEARQAIIKGEIEVPMIREPETMK